MAKSKKRNAAAAPESAPAPATNGAKTPPWRHERLLGILCALVSGSSWFLATANFDIWPLAWFGSVPLLFVIERASTTRRAMLFAWLAGLVTHAGGFYWITNLLERFAHMPSYLAIPIYLLMAGYQAVFLLFGLVVRRLRTAYRLPMALVAPLVMVAFELLIPYLFPCNLAISQAWQAHVIQIADLTGPLGVTGLLLMSNGAIYDALHRRWRPVAIAAGVLVASLVYGHIRIGQMDDAVAAAPKLKVGLVQGNVGFDEKAVDHPENAGKQLKALQDRSVELEREGAELIVWTESSYPYALPRNLTKEPGRGVRSVTTLGTDGVQHRAPAFTAPLLFGAITYDVDEQGHGLRDKDPYNTAIMVDPEGNFTGRFDKMYLVMFSEHIPFVERFPWLRKILPRQSGNFTPGKAATTFEIKTKDGRTWKLGPLICFEDIIPAFGRAVGELGPHLFVNITNDAWFGASSEPWEHLALSVFRTVESRTAMVRAVNTGVSAFIDPAGRVYARTYSIDPADDHRGADKLFGEVPLIEAGHTVYAKVGDLFGYLALAATVFLWLILPRIRRRLAR